MVLLCNDNPLNIKKYHMLQCLNKKKENFNIFVLPLKEKEEEKLISNNIDFDITDKELKEIFSDKELKEIFSDKK